MTPRMIVVALACLLLLFVLLFLAGVEIGQKLAGQSIEVKTPDITKAFSAPPKLPGVAELATPLLPAKP